MHACMPTHPPAISLIEQNGKLNENIPEQICRDGDDSNIATEGIDWLYAYY